jgi:hypothetical protein
MAVAVRTSEAFERGVVRPVFDARVKPYWAAARNLYDVSRDGRRLLFMSPVEDLRSSPFTVVVNWARAISSPAQR